MIGQFLTNPNNSKKEEGDTGITWDDTAVASSDPCVASEGDPCVAPDDTAVAPVKASLSDESSVSCVSVGSSSVYALFFSVCRQSSQPQRLSSVSQRWTLRTDTWRYSYRVVLSPVSRSNCSDVAQIEARTTGSFEPARLS
jgi:hypothetical protein